jgi:flagellar motor switch/type III secretory pathway protein FliN
MSAAVAEQETVAAEGAGKKSVSAQSGNEEDRWRPVLGLPCHLTVDLVVPGFTVADLLKLRAGSVVGSHWHAARDVPLRVNGTLIGWSEFEVVGNRLAVRLTELA